MHRTISITFVLAGLLVGRAPAQGNPRMTVTLTDGATVDDLLAQLGRNYPDLPGKLETVIPMIDGRHASRSQRLQSGQEVALLLPAAGG